MNKLDKITSTVEHSMDLNNEVKTTSEAAQIFIKKIMNTDPCDGCPMVCDPSCPYFTD